MSVGCKEPSASFTFSRPSASWAFLWESESCWTEGLAPGCTWDTAFWYSDECLKASEDDIPYSLSCRRLLPVELPQPQGFGQFASFYQGETTMTVARSDE